MPISHHTEAFVKTEVGCTVTLPNFESAFFWYILYPDSPKTFLHHLFDFVHLDLIWNKAKSISNQCYSNIRHVFCSINFRCKQCIYLSTLNFTEFCFTTPGLCNLGLRILFPKQIVKDIIAVFNFTTGTLKREMILLDWYYS